MKTKYTVDYFIKKFSAIPNEKWKDGSGFGPKGQACALGHCGEQSSTAYTKEGLALSKLFKSAFHADEQFVSATGEAVWMVNDARDRSYGDTFALGDTPKERILNALELIKAGVKV